MSTHGLLTSSRFLKRVKKTSVFLFWLIGVLFVLFIRPDIHEENGWTVWISGIFVLIAILTIYITALVLSQAQCDRELRKCISLDGMADRIPQTVLFLRSFDTARSYLIARIVTKFWLLGAIVQGSSGGVNEFRYDCEEKLDDALSPSASLIAIGDKYTSFGAAKLLVSDDRWQELLHALADRASLIVVMPGPTEAVVWEISRIISSANLINKSVFIMPRSGSRFVFDEILQDIKTELFTLKKPCSHEECSWNSLSRMVHDETGLRLPSYIAEGGYFILNQNGIPSLMLSLEAFTRLLAKHVRKTAIEPKELQAHFSWPQSHQQL